MIDILSNKDLNKFNDVENKKYLLENNLGDVNKMEENLEEVLTKKVDSIIRKRIIENISSITANKDKKVTAVKFNNIEKAIVLKCSEKDTYDEYVGTALIICEYLFGSKNKFHEYVKNNAKIIEKKDK